MSPPIKFSLRFIAVCILLMLLLHQYGELFIKPLLPLYDWEIRTIADQYQILSFGLDNEGLDRVVRLKVTLAKPVYIAGKFLIPDARGIANASTTTGHVWQMSIVCLAMIFAWPTPRVRTYFIRLAIALPVLALLTMLDIPLALLASLWDLIVQNMAPDTFSPLILWNGFLEQGGRLALGIVGGMLTVWSANLISDRLNKNKME
jgi:hypothetical protein